MIFWYITQLYLLRFINFKEGPISRLTKHCYQFAYARNFWRNGIVSHKKRPILFFFVFLLNRKSGNLTYLAYNGVLVGGIVTGLSVEIANVTLHIRMILKMSGRNPANSRLKILNKIQFSRPFCVGCTAISDGSTCFAIAAFDSSFTGVWPTTCGSLWATRTFHSSRCPSLFSWIFWT